MCHFLFLLEKAENENCNDNGENCVAVAAQPHWNITLSAALFMDIHSKVIQKGLHTLTSDGQRVYAL